MRSARNDAECLTILIPDTFNTRLMSVLFPLKMVLVSFYVLIPPLLNIAKFSTKYFVQSKVCTDEGGIE